MKKDMKKRPQKNTKKAGSQNRSSNRMYNDAGLDDFGLEPPKIYRETQQRIYNQREQRTYAKSSDRGQTRRPAENNITSSEKKKRQKKKREKKNKLRKIFIYLIICIVVIALAVVLSITSIFIVSEFDVKGSKVYTKEQIVSHLTIKEGDRMFLKDIDEAEEYLEKSLPYIYNAEIKRSIPKTIEIKITDAKPNYYIKNADKTYILLDDNFKVLDNDAKKAKGIAITKAKIKSSEEGSKIVFKDEKISKSLESIAKVIKTNDFSEITGIYSNNISENYVIYDKRITFKLGTAENAEDKIFQGIAACEKLNQSNPNAKGEMNITGGKQIYFTEK
ncbi:MAG: FtsQ-type POTRA domain-containing protein [Acetobacter sp.]|nr:FtsQ-type POTRA domain-containing protein [Bacteroides sp.]MCM1341580.1 FtsQ-type POTRA domain-containing protein [Acetobacter sp.]MCM1433657.1 FtsQ-type POTRA domain-containing protein [Clostridiales bacterium]